MKPKLVKNPLNNAATIAAATKMIGRAAYRACTQPVYAYPCDSQALPQIITPGTITEHRSASGTKTYSVAN
jgi:hypothetical protein